MQGWGRAHMPFRGSVGLVEAFVYSVWTTIGEHTRECLTIDVARRLTSEDVLDHLSHLLVE